MIITSRVGRKPISIPAGIEIKIEQNNNVHIKGPKGQMDVVLHPYISVKVEQGHLEIGYNKDISYYRSGSGTKLNRSIAGTIRANLQNSIQGVLKGFEKKLTLIGVGYRAQAKGKILNLTIGYSHPVNFEVPEGIIIETPSQTEIIVKGMNKDLVGLVASKIRAVRPPELYKGKGIRYANEVIILKETKKK